MAELMDYSKELGYEHTIVGMPHRGRFSSFYTAFRMPIQ